MMGVMSIKVRFYLSLASSALFALVAVLNAILAWEEDGSHIWLKWLTAGFFGAAAVVSLIAAFRRRKMTDA
jgi:hypothetical protein